MSDIDVDIDEPEDMATPDADEVFQAEPPPSVPVEVRGVVQVTDTGSRTTGFRSFQVAAGAAQRILDDDPRRKSATIIALDNDIRIAGDMGSAQVSGSPSLPVGVPLTLGTSDEVWAAGIIGASEISVFYELWAR